MLPPPCFTVGIVLASWCAVPVFCLRFFVSSFNLICHALRACHMPLTQVPYIARLYHVSPTGFPISVEDFWSSVGVASRVLGHLFGLNSSSPVTEFGSTRKNTRTSKRFTFFPRSSNFPIILQGWSPLCSWKQIMFKQCFYTLAQHCFLTQFVLIFHVFLFFLTEQITQPTF